MAQIITLVRLRGETRLNNTIRHLLIPSMDNIVDHVRHIKLLC